MVIGLSDFISLCNNGTYIDKTDIIDELAPLLQSSTSIIINRPRRFGKSLMISMLETFFNNKNDNRNYFKGLKIAKSPNFALANSFPVIKLSFKTASNVMPVSMIDTIKGILATIYEDWSGVILDKCNDLEKAYYQSICNKTASGSDYVNCLDKLSALIYSIEGKKPLIFIDEYDAPIEASYGSEQYKEILYFLKSLYIATFKDTPSYGFGFITGVFGIAKGTLGTGLNNIPVDSGPYSPLSKNYFGFTDQEVRKLCFDFNINEQDRDKLMEYYGGYHYLGDTFYNPWSILNYIATRNFSSFWGNSGSNKAFAKVIDAAYALDDELIANLLSDGVEIDLDFTASYEDIDKSIGNILLYLVLAGYLTVKQTSFGRYFVYLPNKESKSAFLNEIVARYKDKSAIRKIIKLKNALTNGDGDELISFFRDFLLSSLSYYDFNDEKNYQIMVGTIAALLFDDCIVKHELIAGTGRCDVMISPLNEGRFGAVIEIKYLPARTSSSRLQEKAKTALNQIKKHHYVQELLVRNACPIIAYGFAFYKNNLAVEQMQLR